MPKKLSEHDLEDLKLWLQFENVNIRKLHREFSDVAPVAKLIKQYYPRIVNVFYYPPKNSLQLKLSNWEAFNHKVLSKIGIQRTRKTLENIAKASPGAIELLLHDILTQIKKGNYGSCDNVPINEKLFEDDKIMTVTVNRRIGSSIVQVPQKMISYTAYEYILNELQTKDSYLEAAQQKVAQLENLLKLKDAHIQDLNEQLVKFSSF